MAEDGGEVAGAAVEYLGVAQGGERLQLAGIGIANRVKGQKVCPESRIFTD